LIKKIPLSGVKHLSLGEIVIKRQNIAVDGTILSGEVDSATISATSTIASLNNKVLLLAAMPTTALATKAVDTLIAPRTNSCIAMVSARALFFKAANEIVAISTQQQSASSPGISALSTLAASFLSKVNSTSLPSEDAWGELMGTLDCLKAHFAPWYKSIGPWNTNRSIAQEIDKHLGTINDHMRKIAGPQKMKSYAAHQAKAKSSFLALRRELKTESISEWVLADPNNLSPLPIIRPVTLNPYFADSSATTSRYEAIEKKINALIDERIRTRAEQVKDAPKS
jgi:hypothetical protein